MFARTSRVCATKRGIKILVVSSTKTSCASSCTHAYARGKAGEKCAMQHCSMLSVAWNSSIVACLSSRRSPGAKESHIHGIYGGIALLEHLRTMTMHLGALLRARRAIRVMYLNAPSDSLFLSQFLRIVTQRRSVVRNFKTRFSSCARAQNKIDFTCVYFD